MSRSVRLLSAVSLRRFQAQFLFYGVLCGVLALASQRSWGGVIRTDDSDLSSGQNQSFRDRGVPRARASRELRPDRIETEALPQRLVIQVVRETSKGLEPVPGLRLALGSGGGGSLPGIFPGRTDESGEASWPEVCSAVSGAGAKVRVRAVLAHPQFSISSPGFGAQPYEFLAEVSCEGRARLILRGDSDSGQALGIWQVAWKAQAKIAASVGLGFWTRPVMFSWPSDGDYYTGGVVHLTRGDHWDVVGHEMGHAIFDLGRLGVMAGGQHKIDECYTEALALSEGWASFFSAFVSLSRDDPDARFEFLVPRRAPIRIENVPADVCAGESNEWRVAAFFWDLLDTHADGETLERSFEELWRPLEGGLVGSSSQAVRRLVNQGVVSQDQAALVWRLNFLLSSNPD